MKWKLVFTAVLSGGISGYLAWAFTADAYERKQLDLKEEVESLQNDMASTSRYILKRSREIEVLKLEIEDLQDELLECKSGEKDEPVEGDDDENSPEETSDETFSEEDEEEYDEEVYASRKEHLLSLIEQYKPPEKEVHGQEAEDEFADVIVAREVRPYERPIVITEEEFVNSAESDADEYSTSLLQYYKKYQILVDEDEEPVDDVDGLVGWRALQTFNQSTSNPPVIYVRNRRLQMDFEIELEEEDDLPMHIQYAMPKIEFLSKRAAGKLRLPDDD